MFKYLILLLIVFTPTLAQAQRIREVIPSRQWREGVIQYPPPAEWQEMKRRRAKWKRMDIAAPPGSNEERILKELDKETSLEYHSLSLLRVLSDISFRHNIPIHISPRITTAHTDTVQIQLRGVKLKYGLKLILEEHGLAYIVWDDVLKVGTIDEAEHFFRTKLYYAGDLVVPPRTFASPMVYPWRGGMVGGVIGPAGPSVQMRAGGVVGPGRRYFRYGGTVGFGNLERVDTFNFTR